MKRNYSLCTLRPHSESDKQKFQLFRVEDIVDMYSLYMVMGLIFQVLYFTSNIEEYNTTIYKSLAIQTGLIILQIISWVTRRRF